MAGLRAGAAEADTIAGVAVSDFLRNPFSFLFARPRRDDRVAAYVIREHGHGRPLADVMEDPYIRNRCSTEERNRLLDRPEIIRAISEASLADAREALASATRPG